MTAPSETEANYRDLVENASDIIYSHDLSGHFTCVNKAVERITGYPREEILRKTIWRSSPSRAASRWRACARWRA